MKTTIAILLLLAFVGNGYVIGLIYPEHVTDYDEFLNYYRLRNIVYEAMFCAGFYLAMVHSQRLIRGVCKFGFLISFASFFDKAFLGITWYLNSDILMVLIAFEISLTQYLVYDRKIGRRI